LVILTSNREREFPPAFMRRCLQLDVPLPTEGDLREILQARLKEILAERDTTGDLLNAINALAKEFYQMREGQSGEARLLATDQLINAAYTVLLGGDLAKRPDLKDALLRSLKED
jgi:MoxR-like ATPase